MTRGGAQAAWAVCWDTLCGSPFGGARRHATPRPARSAVQAFPGPPVLNRPTRSRPTASLPQVLQQSFTPSSTVWILRLGRGLVFLP